MCVRVFACVYCLANLICSFFLSFLFFFVPFLIIIIFSLLFFYYISHSTDSSGMCIFFLCECSFLVNRLKFEKKTKNQEETIEICFGFFFSLISFCLWFFFFFFGYPISCLFYPRLVYVKVDKTEQIKLISQRKIMLQR